MENNIDLSRCTEPLRGVVYRRWVITSNGLRQLFRLKFFVGLFVFAWTAGLLLGALGFVFGEALTSGGWLEQAAQGIGARAQAMASALGGMVLLYPDVCVHGVYTLLFWLHSFLGLWLCLVALTVLVPRLVTADRASNALIMYMSRPLTAVDYFLGKLGIIVAVLLLLWVGPLLAGWLLGMLFAPTTDFLVYSFTPLLRALAFSGIALVVLSAIALGISALGKSTRLTIVLWIGLWLLAGALAEGRRAPVWLQRMSFTHTLADLRNTVMSLDTAYAEAAAKLPLLSDSFSTNLQKKSAAVGSRDPAGTWLSLGAFTLLSSFVFFRKLRSE